MTDAHLEASEVAAYVDGSVSVSARARMQAHAAQCDVCRDELLDITRLAAARKAPRVPAKAWMPAVAAAALAFLLVMPRNGDRPQHREAAVTSTVAPRALSPIGLVDSTAALTWSSVPHADVYHVRLFDSTGTVLWERDTPDTTLALQLPRGVSYFWKVDARTGFDRSASSELTEFHIRGR